MSEEEKVCEECGRKFTPFRPFGVLPALPFCPECLSKKIILGLRIVETLANTLNAIVKLSNTISQLGEKQKNGRK